MEKIQELKIRIIERVDILNYFSREQTPFPLSAYKLLSDELKAWKMELAEMEYELAVFNYKLIKSN
jgi:hypothetical protein